MRTILVPVDSMSASENAVNFAVEWGNQYGYNHIILLKTSYESLFHYINISEGYVPVNGEHLNKQHEDAEILLEQLRRVIIEKSPAIKVSTEISELPLLRCTIELIKNDASVDLLILGNNHKVVSNDSFVSANIISIARASPVKVLVVPNSYDFQAVRNILVPCDIGNIGNLDRLSRFKLVLQQHEVRLMLLNVNTKASVEEDIKKKAWEEKLRQYLGDISYDIHYSFDKSIINGILSFTSSHEVDLVISLPGKHSFLYYLANRSISEGIYRNAHHAVLILK